MPQAALTSFANGTLSPEVAERLDLQLYHTGVADSLNMVVTSDGALRTRPGTRGYVILGPEEAVRLFSTSEFPLSGSSGIGSFLLVFTPLLLEVFSWERGEISKVPVKESLYTLKTTTPYTEDDLPGLVFRYRNQDVVITHPEHQPYLVNLSNKSYTADGVPQTEGIITYVTETLREKQLKYERQDVDQHVYDRLVAGNAAPGEFQYFKFVDSYEDDALGTRYIVDILVYYPVWETKTRTVQNVDKTVIFHELISPTFVEGLRPYCSVDYQQRLLFAGSYEESPRIIGSKIGHRYNFDGIGADDSTSADAFSIDLATTSPNPIKYMVPHEAGLFFFTDDNVMVLTGDLAVGTASNEQLNYPGCGNVRPLLHQGRIYYQDISGETVWMIVPGLQRGMYQLVDISANASHFFTRGNPIVSWAKLKDTLWAVLENGDVLSFTSNEAIGVQAWMRHKLPGRCREVVVFGGTIVFAETAGQARTGMLYIGGFEEGLYVDIAHPATDADSGQFVGPTRDKWKRSRTAQEAVDKYEWSVYAQNDLQRVTLPNGDTHVVATDLRVIAQATDVVIPNYWWKGLVFHIDSAYYRVFDADGNDVSYVGPSSFYLYRRDRAFGRQRFSHISDANNALRRDASYYPASTSTRFYNSHLLGVNETEREGTRFIDGASVSIVIPYLVEDNNGDTVWGQPINNYVETLPIKQIGNNVVPVGRQVPVTNITVTSDQPHQVQYQVLEQTGGTFKDVVPESAQVQEGKFTDWSAIVARSLVRDDGSIVIRNGHPYPMTITGLYREFNIDVDSLPVNPLGTGGD